MWKVAFNDCGGYACMTPAYFVSSESTDETVVVDAKNFGWHEPLETWHDAAVDTHQEKVLMRCEVIATAIAVALNILE